MADRMAEQHLFGAVVGFGSLAVGYLFSKLATWGDKEVQHLKHVPRYYNYADLERDLSGTSTGIRSRVMVEGVARKEGIAGLYSDNGGVDGAAKLVTTTEMRRVYNDTTGKWEEKGNTMTNQSISIPFLLKDRAGNRITVENVHLAHGFQSVLQLVYQTKTSPEQRSIGDYATNVTLSEIPMGSRIKEHMLLYGTTLAVLGDAMQFGVGNESRIIFYPEEVGKSISLLISRREMFVHFSRFMSTLLIVGGISLLALTVIVPIIRERQRRSANNMNT